MLLSVIVPVYNVKDYLDRCIRSILNQSFSDLEVIIVDDGSTDGSEIICDTYNNYDQRIRVYHKKNGGLSDARNFGLKLAKGNYISFIDSDDYIVPTAYEVLIEKMERNNLDIIKANNIRLINGKFFEKKYKFTGKNEIYTGVDFLVESIKDKSVSMCSVFNIYKKSLIMDNNLFFKKGIYHEDELWLPVVYLLAKRVEYYDFNFYINEMRENSITQMNNKYKHAVDLLETCYELNDFYRAINISKKQLNILLDYLAFLYLNAFYIGKFYKNEHKKFIDKKFVLKNSKTLRNRFKAIIFVISPRLYCKVNFYFKNLIKSK